MAGRLEILLVDDDPVDLSVTASVLRRAGEPGFSLRQASTLEDAQTSLNATSFDVVVLDLGLEATQGVDTVRAFNRIVGEVPMVVLTGAQDDATGLRCIEAGADDFVTKDSQRDELPRALEFSVRRTRARADRRRRMAEAWRMMTDAQPLSAADLRTLESELYALATLHLQAPRSTEVVARVRELAQGLLDKRLQPTTVARALTSTPYELPGAVVELGHAVVACLGDGYRDAAGER